MALIMGPLVLVQIGVLTWVTDNFTIGLIGLIGFIVLMIGTVSRLAAMGFSRWLAPLVLLPYGLNLLFVVYLLTSERQARGSEVAAEDLRSVAFSLDSNREHHVTRIGVVLLICVASILLIYAILADN